MTDARIVVVGGGHNGLVAAILAADAGYRVTLLERSDHLGGASVGAAVFSGHEVRLSRYSYLVSLFPDELATRLGIDLRLASRRVSSFTPVRTAAGPDGLLVERRPGVETEESFRRVTGSAADFRAWQQLYDEVGRLAAVVAPALSGPLRTEAEVRKAVVAATGAQLWTDLVEAPIGEMVTRRFGDDTVRGVVATDALIGTHTSLFDAGLAANRCFLYHLIGRGTGEWLVPIGGMGGLADALIARAGRAGVEMHCGVEILAVDETAAGGVAVGQDRGRPGGGVHRRPGAGRGGARGGAAVVRARVGGSGGGPGEDQHAAGPVATAGIRCRPGGRLRRHHPSGGGFRRARGGLPGVRGRARSRRCCPARCTATR